jgi:hypothetical protein
VLVSVDGLAWIRCNGKKWVAFETASSILGHITTRPREAQLRKAASDWQDDFENFFKKNACDRPTEPPSIAIIQLLLVARSVEGNILKVNASFSNDAGKLHRDNIDVIYPPKDGSTYSRVNGSCGIFKTAAFLRTPSENSALDEFARDVRYKPIAGVEDLAFMGLKYEAFASSVSQRLESETGRIADVSGPYDEATLDSNQNRWTLKLPSSECSAVPLEPNRRR